MRCTFVHATLKARLFCAERGWKGSDSSASVRDKNATPHNTQASGAYRSEIAKLRRKMLHDFDEKEELKHRYRLSRDDRDRDQLVAAQVCAWRNATATECVQVPRGYVQVPLLCL